MDDGALSLDCWNFAVKIYRLEFVLLTANLESLLLLALRELHISLCPQIMTLDRLMPPTEEHLPLKTGISVMT